MNTRIFIQTFLAIILLAAPTFVQSEENGESTAPLHPTLTYTAGWLGNTFAGQKWVQKDGQSLAVSPDGRCYVGASHDEAGEGLGIYKDGDVIGMCKSISVTQPGIAVDDKYVYGSCPNHIDRNTVDKTKHGAVQRWNLDGTNAFFLVPAPGPKWNTAQKTIVVTSPLIWGIAAGNGQVYVGDFDVNLVRVYDRESFDEIRSFPCTQPFRMTVDKAGNLWVLQRPATMDRALDAKISQFTFDGKKTGKIIENVRGATALASAPNGTLLVAGPNQQVIKYDISGSQPKLIGTLGVKGGVYEGNNPGSIAPERLQGLWGVGSDAQGNIFTLGRSLATGGDTDLRAFSSDGKPLWQLINSGFTDCADVDPDSDGLDVYTRSGHYVIDPAQPPGKQWTWKGSTLDPSYDDGRIEGRASNNSMFNWGSPMMRRLDGRLYMFLHPGYHLGIFRKGPGEIFIPSGDILLVGGDLIKNTDPNNPRAHYLDWPSSQPNPKSRWIWRDANGDGKMQPEEFERYDDFVDMGPIANEWVDKKGDIWLVGAKLGGRFIWRIPLLGFDKATNPLYRWDKSIQMPLPREFRDCVRIIYDSDTDTMYLSGQTPDKPKTPNWGSLGSVVIAYDHWSDENKRIVKWRIDVPAVPNTKVESYFTAMSLAGNRLFLMQRFWSRIWTYSADTGEYVGMITTTPELATSGWCDMPNGISAFRRKDGNTLIFTEDDYRPKVRFYELPSQNPKGPVPVPNPEQ